MVRKTDPLDYPTDVPDPMVSLILKEAKAQGMPLNRLAAAAGLSGSFLRDIRYRKPPYAVGMPKLLSMARAIGGSIVLRTSDGRLLDPYA